MKRQVYIIRDKERIIESLSKEKSFSAVKVYSETEFMHLFPYKYSNEALLYIMKKYHVLLEVAKMYLENICRFPVENQSDEKCLFLSKIKSELIEEGLLVKNTLMERYLNEAEIFLDDPYMSADLDSILQNFSIQYVYPKNEKYLPTVYCLENEEEEIVFVLEKVADLIHQGIDINHIILTNVPESYYTLLKRISYQMNIPVNISDTPSLSKTTIGTKFIANMHLGLQEALNILEPLITTSDDEEIYNQIIQIVNKYLYSDEAEVFVLDALKHSKVKMNASYDTIKVVPYKNYSFMEDDYVFFLSFNSDTIPVSYKDEEYLSDRVRGIMGLATSKMRNKKEKEFVLQLITSILHCTITYKKHTLNKESYPSSLLEDFSIQTGHINYNVSDMYNQYTLAKMYDNYTKFGTVMDDFVELSSLYEIPYHTYSNLYKPIPDIKILNYLKNKLILSYSKMNSYLACPFSFYLKYILKISPYEETFPIRIGNIFHKILERMEEDEFDYDYIFSVLTREEDFSAREKFLLEHLKEEFRYTLNLLQDRRKYTELHDGEFERVESINIPAIIPVTFEGKIDLIRYNKDRTVFSLTDYKTGVPYLDSSIMPLGFSLQLPTYLYLLKHDEEFKNMQCGGFYLQPIFIEKQKEDMKTDYEVIKNKAFKAVGYSNNNQDVLGICDYTYPDSVQIKSLKTKNDGSFYHYSKVFDSSDLETLYNLVEQLIEKSLKGILEGDFTIEPKIVDNKTNLSCTYCPFQDICFHTPKDNVYVNSDGNFLKKEVEHGLDA